MSFLDKISNIGVKSILDDSETRRIHLINQTCFFSSVITFGFIPVLFFIKETYYIPYQAATGLLCLFSFFLTGKSGPKAATIWLIAVLSANLFYCSICYHNTGVEYFFLPLAVIPFTTVKKMKISFALMIWCTAGFFITKYFSAVIPVKGQIAEPMLTLLYCLVMFGVFSSLLITIHNLKTANDKFEENILEQKNLMQKQKLVVEEKQKEILDSIHYAQRIQRSLITNEKYFEKHLTRLGKRENNKNQTK